MSKTLKQLSKEKGYSATTLAYHIGAQESQVYAWSRREKMPSGRTIIRLVDLLGPEVIECFREEAVSAK